LSGNVADLMAYLKAGFGGRRILAQVRPLNLQPQALRTLAQGQ